MTRLRSQSCAGQAGDRPDWWVIKATAESGAGSLPPELDGDEPPALLLPYQLTPVGALDGFSLVVWEKSRRIGATWGLGSVAVLTAGAQKPAGGMDVLYIGYNLDMAREFIDACAMWARSFAPGAAAAEEFLLADQDEKGESRAIGAFRIKFASGFEIVALSSRPRSLRGRQGLIILDEFAFHDDAAGLLKAAMAMLIWGGKVLIVSTHNGADNPFVDLIEEIRAKKRPGIVLRTTFDEALEQGLYNRICLVAGKEWSIEAEVAWRAEIRAYYGVDAAEELDCVPALGSGVYLTGALIEACMSDTIPVLRLTCPDDFALKDEATRESYVRDWLTENVDLELEKLDKNLRHSFGLDFGRTGALSVYLPLAEERSLLLRAPFILEMRNVPFEQQKQVVFHITDKLPRFAAGKLDARGNGQYLAEVTMQRYGALSIEAVMLTQGWYLEHAPRMKARFEDRTILIGKDADVKGDFRLLQMVRGIPMIPNDVKTRGSDGGERHGDCAVAGILAVAAAESDVPEYGYRSPATESAGGTPKDDFMYPSDDAGGQRPWWKQPLGSGMRGDL